MLVTPLSNLIRVACDEMAVGKWGALEVRLQELYVAPTHPIPKNRSQLAAASRRTQRSVKHCDDQAAFALGRLPALQADVPMLWARRCSSLASTLRCQSS